MNFTYWNKSKHPNFSLNWQFRFLLDRICPKCVFPVLNRKKEHHYWIMSIQINLGTRNQLNLEKFGFFDQVSPWKVSTVENRKNALLLVLMVVTYYIKLSSTGTNGHKDILMFLLLLVVETNTVAITSELKRTYISHRNYQ